MAVPSPSPANNYINTQVNRLKSQFTSPQSSPVNQNGSFEFDRVLKSGYVQKRTQKTKVSWHNTLTM